MQCENTLEKSCITAHLLLLMRLNYHILLLKCFLSFDHSTKCKDIDHHGHEPIYIEPNDSGVQGITTSRVTLAMIVCISLLLVPCKFKLVIFRIFNLITVSVLSVLIRNQYPVR